MAVGPGAALGAADSIGRVDGYVESTSKMPADALSRCPLTLVDVDDVFRAYINAGVDVDGRQVPVTARTRAAGVKRADTQVGAVMASLPPGTTVMLAGLSDANSAAHLRVALASGAGYSGKYLTANSTRTNGLVTLTDVTASVLRHLGLPQPKQAVGSPWRDGGKKPASLSGLVRTLNDQDVAAQSLRRLVTTFDIVLFAIQFSLYGFATLALRRKRRRILTVTKIAALAVASLPVASFLANVVPWWRSHPAIMVSLAIVIAIALVTTLAAAGPWRRSVTGSGAVVAGVTALALTLDVMTGTICKRAVCSGTPRWSRAGSTGSRTPAGPCGSRAPWWPARGGPAAREARPHGRRNATGVVIGAGVVALVIDGRPCGARTSAEHRDVPRLRGLRLARRGQDRPTRPRGAGGGAVFVLGFSFPDSLRANPTHIGEFWKQLIHGDAGTVVTQARLHDRHLRILEPHLQHGRRPRVLVLRPARPRPGRAAALQVAYKQRAWTASDLIAALVTAIVGTLVNDSGVSISAMAFTVAIPLALAATVRGLELDPNDGGRPRPEQQEAQSASTG